MFYPHRNRKDEDGLFRCNISELDFLAIAAYKSRFFLGGKRKSENYF